jgi:hypothetical protein
VNGYVEAFVFVIVCMPVVAGASFLSDKIARYMEMDHFEEVTLMKCLSASVMLPILIVWNGRRWGQLRDRQ